MEQFPTPTIRFAKPKQSTLAEVPVLSRELGALRCVPSLYHALATEPVAATPHDHTATHNAILLQDGAS